MIVTISWPRFRELVKEFAGLPADTSDDEIEVRLQSYADKVFSHCREYGLNITGLAQPATSTIAHFNADISGVGTDWQTGGFNWENLMGGLRFIRAIAVTVERADIWKVCDALVGKSLNDSWSEIGNNLARLDPEELQATFEAWCLKIAWGSGTPDFLRDPVLDEIRTKMAFDECGIADPLASHIEREEFNKAEIEAYKEATGNQIERSWGVIHPDGERY